MAPAPQRPDAAVVPALPQRSGLLAFDEAPATREERIRRGTPLRVRFDVEYRPLPCRTLLNANRNPGLPFAWTINPYRGCEFACRYCYARATHSYLQHGPEDFEKRIYVKKNAAEVLARTLPPEVLGGEPIAIGTATDPYQGAERHFRITRAVLGVLAKLPGLDVSITTKSPLVLRDLDLLQRIAAQGRLRVNVSMTTLRPGLARILEPRAPRPPRRLETIARLSQAGIETALFCMPILPGITDGWHELAPLLRAARDAGARQAFGGTLHLEEEIRPVFLPMLRRHFPQLSHHYEELYAHGRYAPRREQERIHRLFERVRAEVGFLEAAPPTAEPGEVDATGRVRAWTDSEGHSARTGSSIAAPQLDLFAPPALLE